jgi:hypothetical protein
MISDFNSTNDKRNNSHNEKKLLDVYYYIDFDDNTQDVGFIEKCIQLNTTVNQNDFIVEKFVNCSKNIIVKTTETDTIKRGLIIFNKMFRRLKLKSSNSIWFIYLSNGNIKDIYTNVFVVLINQNPCLKTCSYVISKNELRIGKNEEKASKLSKIKNISNAIRHCFITDKTITYTNMEE